MAYASKSLNVSQQQYAQIEKEMLSIAFGCQRFHQYLYGKTFYVETDYKPLEAIFKKPLSECPLRLQRLRIILQNYDLIVKYKPGTQLYFADALSRTSYDDKNFEIDEGIINAQISMIYDDNITSPNKLECFAKESLTDPEMVNLTQVIKQGWPDHRNKLDYSVRPFWDFRHELVIVNGVVFKGHQIVIPRNFRKHMRKIHYNHLGIQKTIMYAKELVHWPLMNKEIEDYISNCSTCLTYQNKNQKETIINSQLPNRPWQTIATDLFHLRGRDYLLIVDYFSKYPEIVNLKENTTSENIIKELKAIFARHGKPDRFSVTMVLNFLIIIFKSLWNCGT